LTKTPSHCTVELDKGKGDSLMSTLLECHNLTKKYGKKEVLSNLNLSLESGQIVGLLGPNASGKTTFMKLANGLLVPTSGKLLINGEKPGVKSRSIVSYLPDANYLPDWMNVNSLVKMFEDFYEDFEVKKAQDMLDRLNIDGKERLKTLSKGTKEKVQLILAMSRKAELYLLDEPIGGVDPAARDYILDTIIGSYSENKTVIISTHLIADIEPILDRVLFIREGQIILNHTVDEIRKYEQKSVDELFREVYRC
jgi:ABC-2 type transport system ATP-binding protein